MINVVVIGGGTGSATLLRGFKTLDNVHLTSIVTVADNGGSTGRIRDRYNLPAMGDIRNVMCAMAPSETLLTSLMEYRFEDVKINGDRDIGGHNLGNLILTALIQKLGNMNTAIGEISKILNIQGDIIPSTTETIQLFARMMDGTIVMGEENIPKGMDQIDYVYYQSDVSATPKAIANIEKADLIVLGIGSLYTSILPNIIIKGIQDAIRKSSAKVIYYCNAMTQPGETESLSAEDHVRAIERHGDFKIDAMVFAKDILPLSVRDTYLEQSSTQVQLMEDQHAYDVFHFPLLNFSHDIVRHDPQLVAKSLTVLFQKLGIGD